MSESNAGVIISDAPPPPTNPEGGANNQPPAADAPFVPFAERLRADAAAADEAIRALSEGRDPTQPAPAPQPPTPAPEVQPVQPPTPPPPANHDAEAVLREQLARAENDAKSWRGRHEAEQRRAAEEIAALRAKIDELAGNKAKDTMKELLAEMPGLTDDDKETYGDQMIAMVSRAVLPQVRQMVLAAVEGIRAEMNAALKPVSENVQQVQMTAAEQEKRAFLGELTRLAPGWESLDTDAAFNKWLDTPDGVFGIEPRSALDKHLFERNAAGVAAIFKAYPGQKGGSSGQQSAGGNGTQAPAGGNAPGGPQGDAPPTLADFAAPGGSRRQTDAPEAGGGQPKVWTRQEISDFYAQVARGNFRDKPVEKERMERAIALAQREGRVAA